MAFFECSQMATEANAAVRRVVADECLRFFRKCSNKLFNSSSVANAANVRISLLTQTPSVSCTSSSSTRNAIFVKQGHKLTQYGRHLVVRIRCESSVNRDNAARIERAPPFFFSSLYSSTCIRPNWVSSKDLITLFKHSLAVNRTSESGSSAHARNVSIAMPRNF